MLKKKKKTSSDFERHTRMFHFFTQEKKEFLSGFRNVFTSEYLMRPLYSLLLEIDCILLHF